MKTRLFTLFYLFIAVPAVMTGCKDETTYPITPEITFKSLDKYENISGNDSLELIFSFTDGDGDVGSTEVDTSNRDIFVKLFEVKNGVFVEFTNLAAPLEYKIPFLIPRGNNHSLKGDIKINVEYNILQPNDTIRYELYMRDRARHQSNIITTSAITTRVE